MVSTRRLCLIAATIASVGGPAIAQTHTAAGSGPVSGTLSLTAQGAAAGVGYTWGDGVLHYAGHNYRFSVNGVTVADVGYSKVHGSGRVYNLKRLQDFSGVYAAATGEATAGNGIAGEVLRNANGVEIRIDEVTKGVRLQGSADGIKLTLK